MTARGLLSGVRDLPPNGHGSHFFRNQMLAMIFTAGKFQGCPAGDLDMFDLLWMARRSDCQLDRAIASQDLRRRQHEAKERRELAKRGVLRHQPRPSDCTTGL